MDNDEQDVPALESDSDNEDLGEDCVWDNIDDDEEEMMSMLTGEVTCLFCSKIESSVADAISHCKLSHHFDIPAFCQRWSIDCIRYIKMINYCRREHPCPDQLTQMLISGGGAFEGDEFMQAVNPDDLMLQFDIESVSCPDMKNISNNFTQDDTSCHISSDAVMALTARVRAVEEQRDLLRNELDRVLQDMEKLKLTGQQLVMNTGKDVAENCSSKSSIGGSLSDEDGYFASYSHHGIHMTMLKDEVRTKSYRDFMLCNRNLFEGKTVLDVGCGTGILSMFAAKAGARQVVAVDSSQIIYQAMDIARENNMHEKITFVKGRLEDVKLPIEKFDVIISEWMGYFLLFEAMLDSILFARDHYLSPTGWVYPDHFTMKVVGISDPMLYQQTIGYWDDVYGFKMSCMKGPVLEEVQICMVRGENVVTDPALIKEIDVQSCKVADLDFDSEFSLVCRMDTELTAVVGYFDTYFMHECQEKIHFSTGPKSVKTHWEQAVMILPKPLPVKKDSSIQCKLTYKKNPHDTRGVVINMVVGPFKLKYILS